MFAFLSSQKSNAGDAVLTTDYDGDYTVKGNGFLLQKNFAIASGATLLILLDYTTYTGTGKSIFLKPAVFSTTHGPVKVTVYRGANYTGGTAVPAYNMNTIIGGESKTTITQGPTGTVKGTPVQEWLVGSGATNQSSGGGATEVKANIIRPNSGKTLMEIVNESGNAITFNLVQQLFEI